MSLNFFKKGFEVLRNGRVSRALLSFQWDGYLKEVGWIDSYRQRRPVDKNNEPLPWLTYGFIEFVSPRLDRSMILIEYGSGNSTLFYSHKVKKVYAVEHDAVWYQRILRKIPGNVNLSHVELGENGNYASFATKLPEKGDVIIIDGRDRVNCIRKCQEALSDKGVIVLDDSERSDYKQGINLLLERNFKRLDFWGIAPGILNRKCTTVFYRTVNCLDI